jgi:hypothetical protein
MISDCCFCYHLDVLQELCLLPTPPSAQQQQVQAMHWAPTLSRPRELLAASYGKTVALYSLSAAAARNSAGLQQQDQQQQRLAGLQAEVVNEMGHPVPVWKLEFNMIGNMLACSLDGVPEVWFWMSSIAKAEEEMSWRLVSKSEWCGAVGAVAVAVAVADAWVVATDEQ